MAEILRVERRALRATWGAIVLRLFSPGEKRAEFWQLPVRVGVRFGVRVGALVRQQARGSRSAPGAQAGRSVLRTEPRARGGVGRRRSGPWPVRPARLRVRARTARGGGGPARLHLHGRAPGRGAGPRGQWCGGPRGRQTKALRARRRARASPRRRGRARAGRPGCSGWCSGPAPPSPILALRLSSPRPGGAAGAGPWRRARRGRRGGRAAAGGRRGAQGRSRRTERTLRRLRREDEAPPEVPK